MIKVTVSPDLLQLPDKILRGVTNGTAAAAGEVLAECRRELKAVDAYATGQLHDAGHVRHLPDRFQVYFPTPASLIEDGRPPGPIPRWSVFQPILERWAAAKGLYFESLYPVALKIKREGYPGRQPFRKAIEAAEGSINRALGRSIEKEI